LRAVVSASTSIRSRVIRSSSRPFTTTALTASASAASSQDRRRDPRQCGPCAFLLQSRSARIPSHGRCAALCRERSDGPSDLPAADRRRTHAWGG
jgi:hypothetical protein